MIISETQLQQLMHLLGDVIMDNTVPSKYRSECEDLFLIIQSATPEELKVIA